MVTKMVTNGKLNNAPARNVIDPVYKNVLQKQNPYEIIFKDFDGKNPIISGLLMEIEGGKLTNDYIKKFLKSAPSVKDLEIQQRLENLKGPNRISERQTDNRNVHNFKEGDKKSSNNNKNKDGLPPPSLPAAS